MAYRGCWSAKSNCENQNWKKLIMKIRKRHPLRTKIDLADPNQVRSVRKRLGVSDSDLIRLVGKLGNSLAAISKEVELERAQISAES